MNIEQVKKILNEQELEDAFKSVYKDTGDLINSHHLEEEDIDGYLYMYDIAIRTNALDFDDTSIVYIEMITLNVYRYAKFYWRGRAHADFLYKLLEESKQSKKEKADFYFELGTYYRSVSRFQKALDCFNKAFHLKKSEESLYYIVLTERFLYPDKAIDIKIQSLISPRVKLALQGKGGLKIDPIEKTEEFMDCYDEVHEKALEILEKEGDLHLCHQMWDILTELYQKRGIFWRSPALMNPRVMFD